MSSNPLRQQFSIDLDPALMAQIDRLSDDRDQAIEEALRLWCQQQTEAKRLRSSDYHQGRHDSDEVGWLV